MSKDPNKYKLSNEEHEQRYNTIEKRVFDKKSNYNFPIAIVVGGQPGSGKSILIEQVIIELDKNEVVVINGDEYRKYHSKSKEILKNDEMDYAFYTDADVRDWTKRLFDKAINEKYNLVFEGTMRTDTICETLKRLKEQGFEVRVKAMSVNGLESYLSTLRRYEEQKNSDGHGRITPAKSHRDAYEGMLDTLEKIEKQGYFDTLEIFTRKKEVVYYNNNKEVKSKYKGLGIRETLDKSRKEQEPSIEEVKEELEWLIKSKRNRGEEPYNIGEILYVLDEKRR